VKGIEKKPKDPKITMKIFRQPGHSVEDDYSGNSIEIINPATGEITKLELFVGALAYSSYFYADFSVFPTSARDFSILYPSQFKFHVRPSRPV
jgi:transposase